MKCKKNFYYVLFIVIIISVFIFYVTVQICSGETFKGSKPSKSNWKDSMYERYDYMSFKDYEPANMKIDYKNIDYELLSAAIFYAVNESRVSKYSLKPFKYSYYLKCSAIAQAYDMVIKKEERLCTYDGRDHMKQYCINTKDPQSPPDYDQISHDVEVAVLINYNDIHSPKKIIDYTYNGLAKAIMNDIYNVYDLLIQLDSWVFHNPNLECLGCWASFYYDYAPIYTEYHDKKPMPKFKYVLHFASAQRVPANPE